MRQLQLLPVLDRPSCMKSACLSNLESLCMSIAQSLLFHHCIGYVSSLHSCKIMIQ